MLLPARRSPFPRPLSAPPLSSPPLTPPPRLLCAGPEPSPSGPRPRPFRASDWPAGPLVGGAPDRLGAVYSKGRACVLSQFLGSWLAAESWARSPFVRPLASDFLLSPACLCRGHRRWGPSTRPRRQRERQLRVRGAPEPPTGKRSAWRTKESPRAAVSPPIGAGLGAAQRARSLPPLSAPAPAAASPSCLCSSTARLAL